jgi:probable phosphomutase (TIGR03848 family)
VTTVLLVRHGRTSANAGGVLAGWTPGVHLDDTGRAQAAALAQRLLPVPLAAVVTSPLERCLETAAPLVSGRDGLEPQVDDRVGECHYGDWQGRELRKLAKDPLWRVVQAHPSAVTFPGDGGESMRDSQARAIAAVRDWNARLGPDATYVVCSHGDLIKSVVADALGLHLDFFQRLVVDPCSLTVVHYTELRPFLVRLNDTGGGVEALLPARRRPRRSRRRHQESDAVVGGGAGSGETGTGTTGRGETGTGTTGTGTTGGAGTSAPGA